MILLTMKKKVKHLHLLFPLPPALPPPNLASWGKEANQKKWKDIRLLTPTAPEKYACAGYFTHLVTSQLLNCTLYTFSPSVCL